MDGIRYTSDVGTQLQVVPAAHYLVLPGMVLLFFYFILRKQKEAHELELEKVTLQHEYQKLQNENIHLKTKNERFYRENRILLEQVATATADTDHFRGRIIELEEVISRYKNLQKEQRERLYEDHNVALHRQRHHRSVSEASENDDATLLNLSCSHSRNSSSRYGSRGRLNSYLEPEVCEEYHSEKRNSPLGSYQCHMVPEIYNMQKSESVISIPIMQLVNNENNKRKTSQESEIDFTELAFEQRPWLYTSE